MAWKWVKVHNLGFASWLLFGCGAGVASSFQGKRKSCVLFNRAIVFIMVDFGWLFFRASSMQDVLLILRQIFTKWEFIRTIKNLEFLSGYNIGRFAILVIELMVLLIIDIAKERDICFWELLDRVPSYVRTFVYVLIAVALAMGALRNYGLDSSTFI